MRRLGLILVFAILFGPLWVAAMVPVYHGALVFGDVGVGFPDSIFASLQVGSIPGFVIGLTYAFLPDAFQRIVFAPLLWAIPSLAWFGIVGSNWPFALEMALVGGFSILICALTVRLLRLDLRSGTRS